MAAKISYLDETLKRLPLILLFGSIGWFGLNMLFEIKADVKEMKMMTFKDKEILTTSIEDVKFTAKNNSNRTTELEKDVNKIIAILHNYKLHLEEEKEDENNN